MRSINFLMSMLNQYIGPAFIWTYSHPKLMIAGGAVASFFVSVGLAKSNKLECSSCHSSVVHRSHRRGLFERLLGFVRIYPYRCDDCRARFWKLS